MECFKFSVFLLCISLFAIVKGETCGDGDNSISCHGVRVVRNVVHQLMNNQDSSTLKLANGIELIETPETETSARSAADGSFIGRISRYMQTHELKLKLKEILPEGEFKEVVTGALKSLDEESSVVEARKKGDKGGGGMMMMMALMMGKMMAALGFGGVGLIAMKALGVSLLALMLAAIIGVKKLAEGGHDDGGHQVQYITVPHGGDHHRRKRFAEKDDEIPLPYRGWSQYAVNN